MTEVTTPRARLEKIVTDGMCIGCGLCAALAGPDRIHMETVENGYQRPVARDDLDHALVDRIYDVCPATRLESLPAQLRADGATVDPIWGPLTASYRAHAADERTRVRAASGGVLTALAKFLLARGDVNFVLHARRSDADLTFGVPHLSRTSEDVDRGTGSIYGPTPALETVMDVLALEEPFAFIGKPCDVSALRNLARFDDRVNRLVKFMLTPVCGGIVPPPMMDRFLASRDVTRQELVHFAYRGEGCPGDTKLETADGRRMTASIYEPYGGIEELSWQLPFRCKVCPDGPGEAADISAGDIWVNAEPDWEFAKHDKGSNAVLVRSVTGSRLFDDAVNAGVLVIEEEITPRFYDTCQPHQVKKKQFTRARWDGMLEDGRTVPRTAGLRLDDFVRALDPETYAYQKSGTVRRIREGGATEAAPLPRKPTDRQ